MVRVPSSRKNPNVGGQPVRKKLGVMIQPDISQGSMESEASLIETETIVVIQDEGLLNTVEGSHITIEVQQQESDSFDRQVKGAVVVDVTLHGLHGQDYGGIGQDFTMDRAILHEVTVEESSNLSRVTAGPSSFHRARWKRFNRMEGHHSDPSQPSLKV
ncbi:hypothetical protein ACOSP7_012710 [Xanthoceras sorbifolium]